MSDEKKHDKDNSNSEVISLAQRRAAQAKKPKAKNAQLTPTLSRRKPAAETSKTSPFVYRLGMIFQLVVVIFAGYLVLRSCGLAK